MFKDEDELLDAVLLKTRNRLAYEAIVDWWAGDKTVSVKHFLDKATALGWEDEARATITDFIEFRSAVMPSDDPYIQEAVRALRRTVH